MSKELVPHGKDRFLNIFRHSDWLTEERVRLWATAFTFAWAFLLVFDLWAHSALGVMDAKGEHMGRDFINYWAGAKLAEDGRAATVYDLNAFHAFQQSLVGEASEWKIYSYPPVLLMLTYPLGWLPFLPGLLFWGALGVGVATYMTRWQTHWAWPLCFIAAFAAPASLWNLVAGQNGFFTAAFLAGGLMLLERRPLAAGVLLGLLCYKPQLGLLIPLALLADRQWRAFVAAGITVALALSLSAFAFGMESWSGFFHQMKVQGAMVQMEKWYRMPTVYAALGVIDVPHGIALAAQAVSALLAAAIVVFTWHGKAPRGVKAASLCFAAFLATPYAWDYDMIVLTFAVIWLVQEGLKKGFLPWEKFIWFVVVLLPTPLMGMAQFMGFQPAPVVLWCALALVLKRVRAVSP